MNIINMQINSEKKHSIRYDAKEADAAVTSIYVMKSALPKPYPTNITITIQHNIEVKE